MNSARRGGRRGPLILFYNTFFGRPVQVDLRGISVSCEITHDRSRIAEADAVVFHLPGERDFGDARKYEGQIWIGWTMESRANTPALRKGRVARSIDLWMSHHRDADIWSPYLPPRASWDAALTQPLPAKTEKRLAVMFQSARVDHSGREAFAAELMRHLPFDSYGSFLQNRKIEGVDRGAVTKAETIGRYRFCLAFENTVEPDYVTEKFFQPLLAGTVPVYLGAPNVADFAPALNAYIDASTFRRARDLAVYLQAIAADEALYRSFLAWRDRPLRPEFVALLDRVSTPLFHRLAELVAARIAQPGLYDRRLLRRYPFGLRAALRTRLRRRKGKA